MNLPHKTGGLARPCNAHDLLTVSEGLQCGNCLALVKDNRTPAPEPPTLVIFRMITGNYPGATPEVVALFPELPGTHDPATCQSYVRNGQHGSATACAMPGTRPATPEDYASLKHHLETYLGPDSYRLKVIRKFTRAHYETRKAAIGRTTV